MKISIGNRLERATNLIFATVIWLTQLTNNVKSIKCMECFVLESTNLVAQKVIADILATFSNSANVVANCAQSERSVGIPTQCRDKQICYAISFTLSLGTVIGASVGSRSCSSPPSDTSLINNCKRLADYGGLTGGTIAIIRGLIFGFGLDIPDFRECYCDTDECNPFCLAKDSVQMFGYCVTTYYIYVTVAGFSTLFMCFCCCMRKWCKCCQCKKQKKKKHKSDKTKRNKKKKKTAKHHQPVGNVRTRGGEREKVEVCVIEMDGKISSSLKEPAKVHR